MKNMIQLSKRKKTYFLADCYWPNTFIVKFQILKNMLVKATRNSQRSQTKEYRLYNYICINSVMTFRSHLLKSAAKSDREISCYL